MACSIELKINYSIRMDYHPKISIITPSYNQGQFLEQTILSVIDQHYPNLEYIIIDGKSTDNSVEIIKRYEKYLTYWVSESDKGQSNAINKGFLKATGDYIGWLNSDDLLTPAYFQNLLIQLKFASDNSVLFYGLLEIMDEAGKHLYIEPFREFISFESILYARAPCIQPGSLFKRTALEQVGYLDEKYHYGMDVDLWLKLLKVGSAQFLPFVAAKLRSHSRSKSNNRSIKHVKESLAIFRSHAGKRISKYYLKNLARGLRYLIA